MLFILIAPRVYSIFRLFKVRGLNSNDGWFEYAVIAIGIPFILPTIICIGCAFVQVVSLLKMNVRSTANARITATIFILTVSFFACNIPYFLYFCLSRNVWLSTEFMDNPATLVSYFVANFPSTIHSILNPMTLLSRGRSLRRHFKTLIPLVRALFPDTQLTRDHTHMESYVTSHPEARAAAVKRDPAKDHTHMESYVTSHPETRAAVLSRDPARCQCHTISKEDADTGYASRDEVQPRANTVVSFHTGNGLSNILMG